MHIARASCILEVHTSSQPPPFSGIRKLDENPVQEHDQPTREEDCKTGGTHGEEGAERRWITVNGVTNAILSPDEVQGICDIVISAGMLCTQRPRGSHRLVH